MDEAEQREQLGPSSQASIHRVGIAGRVATESFKEAADAVVIGIDGIGGEQAAILGEKHEHEPKQHGKQALVDLIGIARKDVFQQLAGGLVMRRLEAAQQFVQRGHYLLGKTCRDNVLILAAGG